MASVPSSTSSSIGDKGEEERQRKILSFDNIIESVMSVVKVSKNVEFKKKCLDVMNAEDFETLERRTKRKLKKLIKQKHGDIFADTKENQTSQAVPSLSQTPSTQKRKHGNEQGDTCDDRLVNKRSDSHEIGDQEVPTCSRYTSSVEINQRQVDVQEVDFQKFLNATSGDDIDLDSWFDDNAGEASVNQQTEDVSAVDEGIYEGSVQGAYQSHGSMKISQVSRIVENKPIKSQQISSHNMISSQNEAKNVASLENDKSTQSADQFPEKDVFMSKPDDFQSQYEELLKDDSNWSQ